MPAEYLQLTDSEGSVYSHYLLDFGFHVVNGCILYIYGRNANLYFELHTPTNSQECYFLDVADGLEWLSDTFGLCQPLKNASSVADLQGWLSNTWFNLAMGEHIMYLCVRLDVCDNHVFISQYTVDYPVDASFLEPLPAWPINVSRTHRPLCLL